MRFSELSELAARVGLHLVSALSVEQLESPYQEDLQRLSEWSKLGRAGEMRYMSRCFPSLEELLPGVRSILTFLVPYSQKFAHPRINTPRGFGLVARYAWGRDYHRVIKTKLRQLAQSISDLNHSSVSSRGFVDAVPILERSLANSARQGFIGKNTMLIRPGLGSYFFLAELLLTSEIARDDSKDAAVQLTKIKNGCGSCTSCLGACPTGALVNERELDSRKCISYLTIEKEGLLSDWEMKALGEWVFGCDICQDCCPFNLAPDSVDVDARFMPESGAGQFLDLGQLLNIRDDREFLARYQGTALMRAGREGLLRNACAVVANQNWCDLRPQLEIMRKQDASSILRTQAQMALELLG